MFQVVWLGLEILYTTTPLGQRMTAQSAHVSMGRQNASPCCVKPGVPTPGKSQDSAVQSVMVGILWSVFDLHLSYPYLYHQFDCLWPSIEGQTHPNPLDGQNGCSLFWSDLREKISDPVPVVIYIKSLRSSRWFSLWKFSVKLKKCICVCHITFIMTFISWDVVLKVVHTVVCRISITTLKKSDWKNQSNLNWYHENIHIYILTFTFIRNNSDDRAFFSHKSTLNL